MLILALDSTAQVASVALCDGERLLAEYTVNNGNTHSETLLPMVESVFSVFGYTAKDIDLFAVSKGPGSFTGVRIGVSTVKGLAFGMNKPCVGVSTLEALAYNKIGHKGLICPVMNARRAQVYTALFHSDGQTLSRIMPDSALPISELDEYLKQYQNEELVLCGDGYSITYPALTYPNLLPTEERLRHQSAYSVAQVAKKMFENGQYTDDKNLIVTYLRPSQAERERAERLKNQEG